MGRPRAGNLSATLVVRVESHPRLTARGRCVAQGSVVMTDGDDHVGFAIVPHLSLLEEAVGMDRRQAVTAGCEEFDGRFLVVSSDGERLRGLLQPAMRAAVLDLYELYDTDHGSLVLSEGVLTVRKMVPSERARELDELLAVARRLANAVFVFAGSRMRVDEVEVQYPSGLESLQAAGAFATGGTCAGADEADGAAAAMTAFLAELPSRFTEVRQVGQGGMGAVYAARDGRTGELVAIKVLDPRFAERETVVRRFYRETVATSNIRHPNIPRILDVQRARLPYYVMEYVDGPSLETLLVERPGGFPVGQVMSVALQAAGALDAAHEMNVVHRDVKPSNMLIDRAGTLKVVDFGIAHFDGDCELSSSSHPIGTPQYMAPEQMKCGDVDGTSDVYSLGFVLYELLAGVPPFPHDHPFARVFEPAPDLRRLVPTVPAALSGLIMRCLETDPLKRFRDGRRLSEALGALAGVPGMEPVRLVPDGGRVGGAVGAATVLRSPGDVAAYVARQLAPRYDRVELLGQGGMGAVFAAHDGTTGAAVAVKVVDPRLAGSENVIRRFYRETTALANLRHPSVPRVFDIQRGDLPYFVMEYVQGESLHTLLLRAGTFDVATTLLVTRQVASALGAVHAAGLVHRDVKPSNIIVTTEGRAVVVDFGLVRLDQGTPLTMTGQHLGTPRYMAPEQMKGYEVGPEADVYSLGLTVYECLSGRIPFDGVAPLERIFNDPTPLATVRPDVPPALAAVVARCLERDERRRYRDGAEVAAALEEL